jgi:hypothetical protein
MRQGGRHVVAVPCCFAGTPKRRGHCDAKIRRLEKGTFAFPTAIDASVAVTPTQLAMALGGLDPAKVRERRYKTPV